MADGEEGASPKRPRDRLPKKPAGAGDKKKRPSTRKPAAGTGKAADTPGDRPSDSAPNRGARRGFGIRSDGPSPDDAPPRRDDENRAPWRSGSPRTGRPPGRRGPPGPDRSGPWRPAGPDNRGRGARPSGPRPDGGRRPDQGRFGRDPERAPWSGDDAPRPRGPGRPPGSGNPYEAHRRPSGPPPGGQRPYGERPFDRRPSGARPSGPRPYEARPGGPRREPFPPRDDRQPRQPFPPEPRDEFRGPRPASPGPRNIRPGPRPWGQDRRPPSPPMYERRPPVEPDGLLEPGEELVAGRRPVEEAFVAHRPSIRLLVVPQRRQALEKLVLHATNLRIPIVEVEGGTLTALAGFDGHQGIALVVEPRRFASIEDILARAIERSEPPFVLVLDSLEDPQNVGTLLRSAEAAGIHGVIFPTRRQAPLSPAAVKASAGAVEHLLLSPVDDLPGALSDLRIRGLRVAGAEAGAPLTARQSDLRGPLAIVVGSEGQGLSPVVRRRCDFVMRIPMRGAIGSLNAAVAGSILLFEALAQRDSGASPDVPETPQEGPEEAEGADEPVRVDAEQADVVAPHETDESAAEPSTEPPAPDELLSGGPEPEHA